jgi:hypothetical protein
MNCKPGDLAIIVNCVRDVELNGRLVEVIFEENVSEWVAPDGFIWWDAAVNRSCAVRSLGLAFDYGTGAPTEYALFEARCVKPLRDPGDDAVDETLLRLPSPAKEPA